MENMTIATYVGGEARPETVGVRLRLLADLAPGATPGIAFTGISPFGFAAAR